MQYRIVTREGRLVASVASDCPRRAFKMALVQLSRAFRDAGVKPAMFDTDPAFRIE